MRILWFSPVAFDTKAQMVGGWIDSLKNALIKHTNYQLGIAFHGSKDEIFKGEDTVTYYNIDITIKNTFNKLYFNNSHKEIYPGVAKKYLKVIEHFNPDIIQVFGTENSFGEVLGVTNIPVVFHLQGLANPYVNKWFSSGLSQFDFLRASGVLKFLKGTGLYHNYYKFRDRAYNERKYFKHGKYFMGRTEWDRIISNLLAPNAKYFHCDELMRPAFYKKIWKNPRNEVFKFISVMNANVYKGIEVIYRTTEILLENKISNFEWNIIGFNYKNDLVKALFRKYPKLKKIVNVKILGKANVQLLIENLLGSNIFVHVSHIDNSPNSVCEAMLLGVPTISSAVGGIPSLIEHRVDGLLFQEGEVYSLAGYLKEMIDDYDLAIKMAENARKKALLRHDEEKIIENLINIYEKIRIESAN